MNLFDPALYSGVRRPLAQASPMPAWCYTSQAFYEREVERVFRKSWNPVGRESDIPKNGDYFTTELAGVPIIVVRDRNGVVGAFVNACRHRGTEMVCGSGNLRVFNCPYHSWCYGLDGQLLVAPGMNEVKGFERSDFPLAKVQLGTWGGFLFVAIDPDCGPLDAYLGELKTSLASYHMEDMVCVRKEHYDLRCNWKLLIENFKESYHLSTVHRTTIDQYASIEIAGYEVEVPRGEYLISFAQHAGSMALLKQDTGFPPIATLAGKTAHGSHFPLVYPAMGLCTTTDCCWYLQLHPQGPGRTKMVIGSLFPKATVERADFDEVVKNYYKRWDITVAEDNGICERQQRGLEAAVVLPEARFGPRESNVHEIDNWVLDRVLDAPGDATAQEERHVR
jgi:choline monooxygenase